MNRLLIDCVHKTGGVVTNYIDVPTAVNFFNRTGRIKSYRVWARKGNRAMCWEGDNLYELESQLNQFASQP